MWRWRRDGHLYHCSGSVTSSRREEVLLVPELTHPWLTQLPQNALELSLVFLSFLPAATKTNSQTTGTFLFADSSNNNLLTFILFPSVAFILNFFHWIWWSLSCSLKKSSYFPVLLQISLTLSSSDQKLVSTWRYCCSTALAKCWLFLSFGCSQVERVAVFYLWCQLQSVFLSLFRY